MAQTQDYNGWTNYQTWVTILWLTNDSQWLIDEATERAKEGADSLADFVGDLWYGDSLPKVTGLVADLLGHAWQQINWHEIAASLIEDAS